MTVHPFNILGHSIKRIFNRLAELHKSLQDLLLKSGIPQQLICCIVYGLLLKRGEGDTVIQTYIDANNGSAACVCIASRPQIMDWP